MNTNFIPVNTSAKILAEAKSLMEKATALGLVSFKAASSIPTEQKRYREKAVTISPKIRHPRGPRGPYGKRMRPGQPKKIPPALPH